MLVEATRVLEDKIVTDVRDVDLGLIYGHRVSTVPRRAVLLGRPGGSRQNRRKAQQYASLGKRFEPTAMLTKLAAT